MKKSIDIVNKAHSKMTVKNAYDTLEKGSLSDAIYASKHALRITKTGKEIISSIQNLIKETEKENLIYKGKMEMVKKTIGYDPNSEFSDYAFEPCSKSDFESADIPKRYDYPSKPVSNESDPSSQPSQEDMSAYETISNYIYDYNACSRKTLRNMVHIAVAKTIISNIKPNEKYELNVNQLIQFGLK